MDDEPWYGVRCLFRMEAGGLYEERITLWRARSFDHAIELAEAEAGEYAADIGDMEYLGLAQAFHLAEPEIADGTEVFSLIRGSDLRPAEYLTRFFDTGTERQQT